MSYSVYVVEDEPPILRNIVKKVEKISCEFKVIGTASNGEDAIKEIELLKPDIVISDIRIPIKNGLDLVRDVKILYPETLCIILSGYQEFDYARQAIYIGVEDYIVKPLSDQVLTTVMEKVRRKIDNMRYQNIYKLMELATNGTNPAVKHPISEFEQFEIIFICLDNPFKNIPEQKRYKDRILSIWNNMDMDTLLKMHIKKDIGWYWTVNGKNPNEKYVIIGRQEGDKEIREEVAGKILLKVKNCQSYATIATSVIMKDFENIAGETAKLAKAACQSAVIGKNMCVNPDNQVKANTKMIFGFSENERKIIMLCKNNQLRVLQKEVIDLMEEWDKSNITFRELEVNLKQVVRVISNNIIQGADMKCIDPEAVVENILSGCNTLKDVCSEILYVINDLISKAQSVQELDSSIVADKILRYIEENYSKKISLNDLANLSCLSETNLCKIFRKIKGESPIDYLLKVRIDKAKEFLSEYPEMKLKDIALMTGFSDQYYFSRVFRMLTGKSPSEYRNSHSR